MNIPIIIGTARKGRQSIKIAKLLLKKIKKIKITTELIDVRDYRLLETNNLETNKKAKKLIKKINSANGLIIVAPEYNHFFPGELKMMLDLLYSQYQNKPVLLIGVSKGRHGGQRMLKQLQLQVLALKMIPFPETIQIPFIEKPISEKLIQKIEKTIQEFKKFTEKNL
jgi:NAD(P)H-dependent FMN reductase